MAVRAELVATLGCASAANARTAVGDGRTADRGQWGIEGAGARASRLGVATMTVLSGAHRWGRSWQSRGAAIVAVLGALACSATLGDRMGAAGAVSDLWGPPRPRLVARWEQAGKSWRGRERRFRSAGTGRCRQPSGTGTAATKAPWNRLGRGYGRLMNDSSRPPLPAASALLRYVGGRRGRRVARGSCGTPRCRRRPCRPCRPGRSPGAHQRAYPATLARGLGKRQARRPGAAAAYPYHDLTGTERGAGRLPAHREAV